MSFEFSCIRKCKEILKSIPVTVLVNTCNPNGLEAVEAFEHAEHLAFGFCINVEFNLD